MRRIITYLAISIVMLVSTAQTPVPIVTFDSARMIFVDEPVVMGLDYDFADDVTSSDFTLGIYIATDYYESFGELLYLTIPADTPQGHIDLPLEQITDPGVYIVHAFIPADLESLESLEDSEATDEEEEDDLDIISYCRIVVDPQLISAPTDAADDFDDFWTEAQIELSDVDTEATFTLLPERSSAVRQTFLVEMTSIGDNHGDPVTIYAYLTAPVTPGVYPAIIHYLPYDSGNGHIATPDPDANPYWVELVPSPRGQGIGKRPPYSNTYGDWILYGFDDRDNYYYRGAYIDALRAVDLLTSLDYVSKRNIFVRGYSQGATFALVASALRHYLVNSTAICNPFMCDFPVSFATSVWPGFIAMLRNEELGRTPEQMYEMLSYFDLKNFAPSISTPVYAMLGLQDTTCPLRSKLDVIHNLATPSVAFDLRADLIHEPTDDWDDICLDFFTSHLDKDDIMTGIGAPAANSSARTYYSIDGRRIDGIPSLRGIYIVTELGRTYKVAI